MTFTLATENTWKCYQAPFPIFRTGPGNEASVVQWLYHTVIVSRRDHVYIGVRWLLFYCGIVLYEISIELRSLVNLECYMVAAVLGSSNCHWTESSELSAKSCTVHFELIVVPHTWPPCFKWLLRNPSQLQPSRGMGEMDPPLRMLQESVRARREGRGSTSEYADLLDGRWGRWYSVLLLFVSWRTKELRHSKSEIRQSLYEETKCYLRAREPVDAFITALYSLTEHCGYGALHDEMIRDRIVIGIRNAQQAETAARLRPHLGKSHDAGPSGRSH